MQKIDEKTHDLTWKALAGKTTGVLHSNDHYAQKDYNDELQGSNLQLAVLATGGGIHRGVDLSTLSRSLYLSLSLSLTAAISLHSSRVEKQKNEMQQQNCLP